MKAVAKVLSFMINCRD